MNWPAAIETNRIALLCIVAEIVALVGVVAGGGALRLPEHVYLKAAGLLRRTESAVRRLIVIAARKLEVKPVATRAWPQGLVLKRKAAGEEQRAPRAMAFKLFDARKRFAFEEEDESKADPSAGPHTGTIEGPRIRFIDFEPRMPLFRPQPPPRLSAAIAGIDATRLCRRLEAVQRALGNLPTQARRMLRWQRRQDAKPIGGLFSPLRPGKPPGHRDRGRDEIDLLLTKIHGLACWALEPNSS